MAGLNSLMKSLYDITLKDSGIVEEGIYHALKMNPPAWLTNSSMPLSKYLPGKRHTIDDAIKKIASYFGKEIDGPIFGSHKTFEGLGIGLGIGAISSYLPIVLPGLNNYFEPKYFLYGLGASVLAAAGDLIGSFIKRRLGKKEGTDVPILDRTMWMAFYPIFYTTFNNAWNPSGIVSFGLTYSFGFGFHYFSNFWGEKMGVTKTIKD